MAASRKLRAANDAIQTVKRQEHHQHARHQPPHGDQHSATSSAATLKDAQNPLTISPTRKLRVAGDALQAVSGHMGTAPQLSGVPKIDGLSQSMNQEAAENKTLVATDTLVVNEAEQSTMTSSMKTLKRKGPRKEVAIPEHILLDQMAVVPKKDEKTVVQKQLELDKEVFAVSRVYLEKKCILSEPPAAADLATLSSHIPEMVPSFAGHGKVWARFGGIIEGILPNRLNGRDWSTEVMDQVGRAERAIKFCQETYTDYSPAVGSTKVLDQKGREKITAAAQERSAIFIQRLWREILTARGYYPSPSEAEESILEEEEGFGDELAKGPRRSLDCSGGAPSKWQKAQAATRVQRAFRRLSAAKSRRPTMLEMMMSRKRDSGMNRGLVSRDFVSRVQWKTAEQKEETPKESEAPPPPPPDLRHGAKSLFTGNVGLTQSRRTGLSTKVKKRRGPMAGKLNREKQEGFVGTAEHVGQGQREAYAVEVYSAYIESTRRAVAELYACVGLVGETAHEAWDNHSRRSNSVHVEKEMHGDSEVFIGNWKQCVIRVRPGSSTGRELLWGAREAAQQANAIFVAIFSHDGSMFSSKALPLLGVSESWPLDRLSPLPRRLTLYNDLKKVVGTVVVCVT